MDTKNILTYTLEIDSNSLKFLFPIIDRLETYIEDELEIDPFKAFSKDFSIAYWYTQYHLLKDKRVKVNKEIIDLFTEEKVNIIWFTLTDGKSFSIKCIDGDLWILEKFAPNLVLDSLLKSSNIKAKPAGNSQLAPPRTGDSIS